jgi:hypothetical protein
MAVKRMFSMTVVDSDAFLDMPLSSQCLYFHLNMRADDDGFIGNPKRIQKMIGSSEDDLKLLLAKRFILAFEDGVIVIKHWKMHNTIRHDRYVATTYQEELSMLITKDNKSYTLEKNDLATKWQPNGNAGLGLGLDIGLDIDIDKDKYSVYGELKNVKLTKEEYSKLEEKNLLHKIDDLSYYLDSTGKKYKSHYATILKWGRDESKKGETSAKNQSTNKSGYDLTGIINL